MTVVKRNKRAKPRWSCSTMLLRYLTWRTTIGTSRPALIASMAALLASLLSIATLSGTPFSRMRLLYQMASFEGTYRRHPVGQVAYLGLVYTFEGSKKAKESDFSYD